MKKETWLPGEIYKNRKKLFGRREKAARRPKMGKTKRPERLLRTFVAGVVSLELTARGFGDRCSTN